ncbi:MAG: hypothetical protein WCK04_04975 [Actinomycetes bacterium]
MARYAMASGRMAQQARSEAEQGDLSFSPTSDLDSDLKGENGQAECSWERTPDGKICITAINGVSVGKYADHEATENKDEESADEQSGMDQETEE